MGNINVIVEMKKEHTYLQDAFLIEKIEIRVSTITGEVVIWNGLDWDVLVSKEDEYSDCC